MDAHPALPASVLNAVWQSNSPGTLVPVWFALALRLTCPLLHSPVAQSSVLNGTESLPVQSDLQLDLLGCQSIPISQWLLIMHFLPVEYLMD